MTNRLKSEDIFDLIKSYTEQGFAKKAVEKCNAVFQFNILDKKGGAVVKKYWIDVRQGKEKVGTGDFDKPDATFVLADDDFSDMCNGKLNPQMAFIRRQMKIEGNFKKASSFTPDLFPKPTPENIAKYSAIKPKL